MDFRRMWIADVISQVGTRVTFLAAPLLAVLTLDASVFEVALVRAGESAGAVLSGLLAGAWVDRLRCRPVLLVTDLGRFALLATIPVAWLLGTLSLGQLLAVMFGVGTLTAWFTVAHQSYLPRLLPAEELVSANAKLAANSSVAAIAGASGGGLLVQLLTAPVVFVVDALSFLWSALWIRAVRHREPVAAARPDRHLGREIAEGLRFVVGQPLLRAITGNQATTVLWQSAGLAVTVVFLVREIGLSAGLIGLLSTVGLLGALVSSALARRLIAWLGRARAMWIVSLWLGPAFLALAFTGPGWGLAWFVVGNAVASFCIVFLNIVQLTCRQVVCPAPLLGRVSATMSFAVWAAMPVGSLLGGVLASVVGLRGTLVIAGVGGCLAALWLVFSPLRRLRDF